MAVKLCPLQIDALQYETDNRGTPMFPCGGYITKIGDNLTERVPWHWHEEVEVLTVIKGVLKVGVPNDNIILRKGESAFINSGVLHTAINLNRSVCEVESFVFDPQLIFGSIESAIEQKYVRPLIKCSRLRIIHFQNKLEWHKDVNRCMKKAFVHYKNEAFGYEFLVRDYLSRLWFLIVTNHQSEIERHKNSKNTEALRVKEMLDHIHMHYAEKISLKSLSKSAAISERECLRCFNKVLGTTPMKYLLGYRISIAANLLANSNLNITEICTLSGFESPSHFSLRFKATTNMTPSEYRQQENTNSIVL